MSSLLTANSLVRELLKKFIGGGRGGSSGPQTPAAHNIVPGCTVWVCQDFPIFSSLTFLIRFCQSAIFIIVDTSSSEGTEPGERQPLPPPDFSFEPLVNHFIVK